MIAQGDFHAYEWEQIVDSVLVAGLAVATADGPSTTSKELIVLMQEIVGAKDDPTANWLVRAAAADLAASDFRTSLAIGRRISKRLEHKTGPEAIETLQRVSRLLDDREPREAVDFKRWLLRTAEKVAEASKEGGFLGFGRVLVSDAEKAALVDISLALNVRL